MKNTGLDLPLAEGIPVGATVAEQYWTVPGHYGDGPRFDTQADALRDAIAAKDDEYEKALEHRGAKGRVYLTATLYVDYRWRFEWPAPPAGGAAGVDTTISRVEYANVDEARAALVNIERWAS